MNILSTVPAGTDSMVLGFFLIFCAVIIALHIAEVRAYQRGRMRRMAEQAKKKAQSAN